MKQLTKAEKIYIQMLSHSTKGHFLYWKIFEQKHSPIDFFIKLLMSLKQIPLVYKSDDNGIWVYNEELTEKYINYLLSRPLAPKEIGMIQVELDNQETGLDNKKK